MTLQQHIDAILSPGFSGEFYYIRHPDPDGSAGEVAATYGVWSIVGGESFYGMAGDANVSRPRIQVSIFTTDNAALVAMVDTVKAAMVAANDLTVTSDPDSVELALYNTTAAVQVDGYEEETGRYYSYLDFYVWDTN
jgi:hypothetical protein